MKNFLLLCFFVHFLNGALAQTPKQINYQGIARNTVGAVIANQSIALRLTIHESKPSGVVIYKETRMLKTNGFGLFITAIGSPGAAQVVGSFASIKWENNEPKYLQVEIDPTGESTFIDMGTSQLLSVPFALYAEKATPTGQASGDLTGSYPAPVVSIGAINTAKLANGAVTTTKLAADAVGTTQIRDGAITAAKLAPGLLNGGGNNGANGQAGGDLTGSYPNPLIANGVVSEAKLADGAITTAKVQDGTITAAKLAPGTVPASLPPSGAASGDLSGAYPSPVIKDGAVTTAKLQDGSITAEKLAVGVIPTALPPIGQAGGDLTGNYPNPSINSGAVTTDKIAAGAITTDKMAPGVIPASLPASGAAGGDLQGTFPNPTLKANVITTVKVQDGAITASKLAPGVIPSVLPPIGTAGGDLSGIYPNPVLASGVVDNSKLANGAVSTLKVQDGAITIAKLAPGTIPTSLAPSGAASGDLTGSYPNPTIANGAVTSTKIAAGAITSVQVADGAVNTAKLSNASVTNTKIADGTITAAKLASGVIPTALPPIGTAGGDLTGSYPNPILAAGIVGEAKLADGAITTIKVQDGAITMAKLAPGLLPATLPPTGAAGGDLSGSYPNPTINLNAVTADKIAAGAITTIKLADGAVYGNKLADASVTATKLAPGVIPSSLPPSGAAAGDLSGTYPNPLIKDGAVTTTKLAADAVGTTQIRDGAITAAKLAPGLLNGGGNNGANGQAGGDLTGSYPNPLIANGVVSEAKLADGAITTAKVQDGTITAAKLAPGTVPASLPPSGAASGDLSGAYPSPVVSKLKGTPISNIVPITGQVLKFDGSSWVPSIDNTGALSLPFAQNVNYSSPVFSVNNQGAGASLSGLNSKASENTAVGVLGQINSATPGQFAAGVKGVNQGTTMDGYGVGVWGEHAGSGSGIYGVSQTGSGVFGTSNEGVAGHFDISNANSTNDVVLAYNSGWGNGITTISANGYGVVGIANGLSGSGVIGFHNAGGEGVFGFTRSDIASGVVGRNNGSYAGVKGLNTSDNGVGVLAVANANDATNGTALIAELEGTQAGNLAVFKANGANVARIDHTGKAFFNGNVQVGGADLAEYFDIEGSNKEYEPGDVLVISQRSDRKVEKSSAPYSTLVAGVYATKPGLLLTEKNAEQDRLNDMVPMGVIGVIPTKVCLEGGIIKRGDLLVTSSIPGVAMKADTDKVRVGQVLGKALQDYSGIGTGKINVLVSVK